MDISSLQKVRYEYKPKLPPAIAGNLDNIGIQFETGSESIPDKEKLLELFPANFGKPIARFVQGRSSLKRSPLRVGVILSGGQAPGGHNVIAGLLDGLLAGNASSGLVGFKGGPGGLIEIGRAHV